MVMGLGKSLSLRPLVTVSTERLETILASLCDEARARASATLAGEWDVDDFHTTFSPHLEGDAFALNIDLDILCT